MRYSADDLIAAIEDLTEPRLSRYVALRVIQPVLSDHGDQFRDLDLARARLLTELSEFYDLDDDSLQLVIRLVDEMHGLRGELETLIAAISQEPDDARSRFIARVRELRAH